LNLLPEHQTAFYFNIAFMSVRFEYISQKWIYFILSGFLYIIPLKAVSVQSQQLTQVEFKQELIKAYQKKKSNLADSLIIYNRLMVKPFVNDLVNEGIVFELKGKMTESKRTLEMAGKAAESFKNIFGERSLIIATGYPGSWTMEQKKEKLLADSLYAVGSSIRSDPQKRDQAIGCHQEALNIYLNIGDERGEAEVLGGFGLIFSTVDLQKSMSYYVQALEKREKVDDKQLIGNSLNSIGVIYNNSDAFSQAIPYFERAEAVRLELGDLLTLRKTQSLMASAYLFLGEEQYNDMIYTESLKNLEKALEINKNLNAKSGVGEVLNQMGFVYSNLGDYTTAVEKISEAVRIMDEEKNISGLAGAYNHLGIVLQMSGRLERALEYYNNSLKIFEELNDTLNIVALMSNIGTIYFDIKEYGKAEEYLLEALKISQKAKEKSLEGNCLLNLANTQSLLGKIPDSLSSYKSGLEIARSLNSPDLTWKFLTGIAEYYEKAGNYDKAIELNDTALNIIDGIRSTLEDQDLKASYIARERFVFEDVITMLGSLHEKESEKGYDTLAFRYAELSKSRAFLDLLAEALANVNEGADTCLLKRQEVLLTGLTQSKQMLEKESSKNQPSAETVTNLKNKIRESEDDLSNLKSEIRTTNPRYADLQYPVTVSLSELKGLCPDKNTVFLEYSLGDSSSCLWVITGTDHKFFRLPSRKILQDQIESLRFALLDPDKSNINFITGAGYSLYRQLIKPAEPFLTKKSRLVIIPDGILNYLPFEVLLSDSTGKVKNTSFSELPFLVKKYPLSYAQSGSVLKNLVSERGESGETHSGSKRIIAFGDPSYENMSNTESTPEKSFPRLEYSRKEVENIVSFFDKGSADIYLQEAATEENVKNKEKLNQYDYVHFATHGYIDEKNPDYSSLVLTLKNNSVEDGFLRATEIFNLKLNAELVVLSACQTGLGKLVRGEGMVGLTRAFMYAGAPAVMVSLWSVSDISTATLMREFYKNMLKGDLIKTDALRKAQLTVMKDEKFAHPFYWAPFVLFGDWR